MVLRTVFLSPFVASVGIKATKLLLVRLELVISLNERVQKIWENVPAVLW